MDRPRKPEPIEPDRLSDQPPSRDTPIEPAIPEAVDSRPDPEPSTQQDTTDPGHRTVEERPTAAAGPVKDSTDSGWDKEQDDRLDQTTARPVGDGEDSAGQQGRRDTATSGNTQSASDSTSIAQDAADRVPEGLREKMLQNPMFTRLGWGSGDDADSDDEDDITPDEQVEGRTSETEEQVPPEQGDVDDGQHAAGGDAARMEDEESVHTDEPATAEQDADLRHDDASHAAPDADVPNAEPPAKSDRSPDVSTDDHDGDNTRHDANESNEAADRPVPFDIDAEVNGELVGARFDRWNPEKFAMPRPPKPEPADPNESQLNEPLDADGQRAVDEHNAVRYMAAHKDSRPWLAPVVDCEPVVQSVYASIDQGGGHGHIRHGAMGTDEMQARRVLYNEDPAQSAPDKRALGIDGLNPAIQHYCGRDSTRIHDATAFAAAYVGATDHPDVEAVLTARWDKNFDPSPIAIPIADLLGPDGHRLCSGFALNDWPESKRQRKQWLQARDSGVDAGATEKPEVEPISTFEGGEIVIFFDRSAAADGYEIKTIFPRVRRNK